MDTSTSEIAVEPDGEHNSALLKESEDFSYSDSSVPSEKFNETATCSSNMEFNQDPFTCSSDDFIRPFNLSDPSGSSCLNDFRVEETDSVGQSVGDGFENLISKTSDYDVAENIMTHDTNHYTQFADLVEPLEHVESVLTSDVEGKTEVKDVNKYEIPTESFGSTLESSPDDDTKFAGVSMELCGGSSSSKDVKSLFKADTKVKTELEDATGCEVSPEPCVTKFELLSEDETNFDGVSRKSCTESSSSKDGSPSEPSCSGTSRTGIHSLSSDSENELPSINIPLPFKKRKREKLVEIISSSSCSEDESQPDIDYANLTPEQIKALIEQAKRYGRVKRKCKCPKKKWSELPIVGPTQGSGKCTVGKGDWSEKLAEPCLACAGGSCDDVHHKRGRHNRKRAPPTRNLLAKSRARGTIGGDVPIIELSDSEEVTPVPTTVVSEVTISAVPPGECIVLSSSEDDDIVCEGVIQPEMKVQVAETEAATKHTRPEVIVINSSSTPVPARQPPAPYLLPGLTAFPSLSTATPCPPGPLLPSHSVALGQDSETWPDLNVDLESWDETMNLLANICGPPSTGNSSRPVATPERPPTPEGWSCPICLESKTAVNEIMSTTCGHVFCGNCIRSSVRIHKKCPTCRKKLSMKQFHKIFL